MTPALTDGLPAEEQVPHHENVFLIYANASAPTGRNLARYLGVEHGKNCSEHYDYLIRWGSSRGVSYIPDVETINLKRAVSRNTNKLEAMRRIRDAGANVPEFSRDYKDLDYPILGRNLNHSQGSDINLILQERDARLTDNDFYVQYIPTELEYRVHVMDGEVFKVHEKRLRSEADNHPYIRNYGNGWVFVNPRSDPPDESLAATAVDAIGLDFGAVDVIRAEDGTEYVLEVNTAPSLDEANLERYGQAIAERVGLNEIPGLDHPEIELDHEDEDEDPPWIQ